MLEADFGPIQKLENDSDTRLRFLKCPSGIRWHGSHLPSQLAPVSVWLGQNHIKIARLNH